MFSNQGRQTMLFTPFLPDLLVVTAIVALLYGKRLPEIRGMLRTGTPIHAPFSNEFSNRTILVVAVVAFLALIVMSLSP